MKEVYIIVKGLEVEELFNKDLVSVDELCEKIIELKMENDRLEEKIEDLENNLKDNYRPIDNYSLYGVSEKEFI